MAVSVYACTTGAVDNSAAEDRRKVVILIARPRVFAALSQVIVEPVVCSNVTHV
jgi:hypothetical protein